MTLKFLIYVYIYIYVYMRLTATKSATPRFLGWRPDATKLHLWKPHLSSDICQDGQMRHARFHTRWLTRSEQSDSYSDIEELRIVVSQPGWCMAVRKRVFATSKQSFPCLFDRQRIRCFGIGGGSTLLSAIARLNQGNGRIDQLTLTSLSYKPERFPNL